QEGAIRGHIMQPITPVLIADFTMFARNRSGRIGQGPIEVSCSPDIDATFASDPTANGPAIRQGGLVDQLQNHVHGASIANLFYNKIVALYYKIVAASGKCSSSGGI